MVQIASARLAAGGRSRRRQRIGNDQSAERWRLAKAAGKTWLDGGGELIELPADEQAQMLKTLASVGEDVSKAKPALAAAYKVVADAAQRSQ